MSLTKQLWIAIIFIMTLSFFGSFAITSVSTKHYLEEQLYNKNIDNASMIALSLTTHAQDPTFIELLINSQFDSGHYQFINLVDTEGNTLASQVDPRTTHQVPHWLTKLFPLKVKAGYAHVNDGWKQIGTLTLSAHQDFVYLQLWNNTKNLFLYFLSISILIGLVGSYFIRSLTTPLKKAVQHAEAIGERRFIFTQEPRTLEFKAVIRSMNTLSSRVKHMLTEETEKLDNLRREVQYDAVSGLLGRDATLGKLSAYLERDNENANGAAVLLRIADMQGLNKRYGRVLMDKFLANLGKALRKHSTINGKAAGFSGRLNGSDFLVILPSHHRDDATFGTHFIDVIHHCFADLSTSDLNCFAASTWYHKAEGIGEVLSRLDSALDSAVQKQTAACFHIETEKPRIHALHNQNSRPNIRDAFKLNQFTLAEFMVYNIHGELMHVEVPPRLTLDKGETANPADFLPLIIQEKLETQLDLHVLALALNRIATQKKPVSVNISAALLEQNEAIEKAAGLIQSQQAFANHLWLEIAEYGVYQHFAGFRKLCQQLKPLGCNIGVTHVGHDIELIGNLNELGIDFVKIDSSFTRKIHSNTAHQIFLRGLCTLVHSIGIRAIAESVLTETEWNTLKKLGIDGGSGAYFS